MTAKHDIKRACLAYLDYIDTVEELSKALGHEEKDVLARARKLRRGSEMMFAKLEPEAVARIHSSTSESSWEEVEEEKDMEDLNTIFGMSSLSSSM